MTKLTQPSSAYIQPQSTSAQSEALDERAMLTKANEVPIPEIVVPDPPDHSGALAEVPADVQDRWRAAYRDHCRTEFQYLAEDLQARNAVPGQRISDEARKRIETEALREANALLKVPTPQSYEDAQALPGWQVIKRETIAAIKLPAHVNKETRKLGGHFLRVLTTEGREYFFPIPEAA